MTFTKTPPQQPGFYAWKPELGISIPMKVHNFDEKIWTYLEGKMVLPENIGGEWCRLVPAEEIEKAYREGWDDNYFDEDGPKPSQGESYNYSRAKRVAEGKE